MHIVFLIDLGAGYVILFFFFEIFLMWTIFNICIEFVSVLFLFLCFGFWVTRQVGS